MAQLLGHGQVEAGGHPDRTALDGRGLGGGHRLGRQGAAILQVEQVNLQAAQVGAGIGQQGGVTQGMGDGPRAVAQLQGAVQRAE